MEETRTDEARTGGAPNRWVDAFVLFGIFLYAGARISLSGTGEIEEPGTASPLGGLLQLLELGAAGLLLLLRPRILGLLPRAWPLLLTFGVVLASVLWSQLPDNTLRRSVTVLIVVLYVVTVSGAAGGTRFMRLTLGALLVTAVGSLAEAVLRPAVGWDVGEYANAVRGMYTQKNGLGMAMLNASLALSFLVLQAGRLRWRDGAIFAFLLVVLLLSRSTTSLLLSLLTGGLTVVLLGLLRGGGWRMAALTGLAIAATVVAILAPEADPELLFDAIGKDSSLTGRTTIWEVLQPLIERHPLLGYGYGAFWVAGTGPAEGVWYLLDWKVPSAHSGLRDVRLQLGWLGVGLLGVLVLVTLWRAARAFLAGHRGVAAWTVMFLLVQAVLANSESTLLNMDLGFVIWMMVNLLLAGLAARRRAGPAAVHGGRGATVPGLAAGRIVRPPFAPAPTTR